MPAIATGQVKLTRVQTSRIRSLVDGKVAMAKSAQKPATRKPAPAHIAIRYFMVPLLPFSWFNSLTCFREHLRNSKQPPPPDYDPPMRWRTQSEADRLLRWTKVESACC